MKMKTLLSFLASFLLVTSLVYSQADQAGFISIDCGASADYTDSTTGLNYQADTAFRESGVVRSISNTFQTATLAAQLVNLRSFPNGTRNCYTVRPSTAASRKFLIRARFFYANYDGLNTVPTFDLYLGTNLWSTIQFIGSGIPVTKEIIVNITSIDTSICLVNTRLGTPFISALELRPIPAAPYSPTYGGFNLYRRFDFGSNLDYVIRYKADVFDRLWVPFSWPALNYINTSLTVDANATNIFQLPSVVTQTAVTPKVLDQPIVFYWVPEDPTIEYYVYMHFAEIEILQPNQTRVFDIFLNDTLWYSGQQPTYLSANTIYSKDPKSSKLFNFSLVRTANSTLPPLINAVEFYEVNKLLQSPTSQEEVDAMKSIKSSYGINKNWQGDPCAPQKYTWSGLNCSFPGYNPPRITYLNLSSSGLSGEIPSYISDLKYLQILDLSDNKLTGSVPGFLTQLSSLTVLNLAKNNLSGSVPPGLLEKSKSGLLSLSLTGNLNITGEGTNTEKKSSSSVVVPIIASIAGVVIFIILVVFAIWFCRKKKAQGRKVSTLTLNRNRSRKKDDPSKLEAKNRQVTYSEVETMTNNFDTVIGEGGFGTVYKGYFDGAHVAVKMLSPSSAQGYKEFHAEVRLLMIVHHRNLTSLVGYCDEANHKALIYEYMANGDLAGHLSARSANHLTWEERLGIAVDSAQGLEYLHNGCRPPIVHRDVKTTNILLNETFQAKIADFGLSRVNPADGGDSTRVPSTVVAGTPGYLDPEYYISNRLHEKSDVFSFGVVLLEIITSRAVIARNQQPAHISQWVSNMLEQEGDVRGIIDPRLRDDLDVNSVWKAVEVAMACVSPTSARRPTMTEVVTELKECLSMETSRTHSRATISSNSVDMAALSYDTGLAPIARGNDSSQVHMRVETKSSLFMVMYPADFVEISKPINEE